MIANSDDQAAEEHRGSWIAAGSAMKSSVLSLSNISANLPRTDQAKPSLLIKVNLKRPLMFYQAILNQKFFYAAPTLMLCLTGSLFQACMLIDCTSFLFAPMAQCSANYASI